MPNNDRFFSLMSCDRCGESLPARIMSWFTDSVLCMECHKKELEIRNRLPEMGKAYEGCGYIPKEALNAEQ